MNHWHAILLPLNNKPTYTIKFIMDEIMKFFPKLTIPLSIPLYGDWYPVFSEN